MIFNPQVANIYFILIKMNFTDSSDPNQQLMVGNRIWVMDMGTKIVVIHNPMYTITFYSYC